MPEPKAGESQSHFMNRCVPIVIADGAAKNQKQAVAICMNMYRGKDMSNARKKRKTQVADDPQADKEMEQLTDDEAEATAKSFTEDIPNMYAPHAAKQSTPEETIKFPENEKMVMIADEKPIMPFGGAQSLSEVKEYIESENVKDAERKMEDAFNAVIDNIRMSDLTLAEKAEKIAQFTKDFNSDDEVESEPDLLAKVLSAIGLDSIAKARITRANINDLPDSKFAYVEPGGKKDDQGKTVPRSLRHYPINDAAHVRNALARAAQQIKKGGKSAEVARKAIPKIRAAAKKLGIGKSSDFSIFKDLQGNDRWLGRVSNKWRDRENEIISEDAHKEFVEWVYEDKKNRMPQLWLWHTPWTAAKARADFLDYADGFLIASGTLTKDEAAMYNALAEKHDLAMSHGFFQDEKSYDKENKIINRYVSFEGSALPIEHVANEWTDFTTLQEVKDMGLTAERREFLVDAIGEERVAQEEGKNKDLAEALKELKVDFKEADEEETQPVEVEQPKEEEVSEDGKGLDVAALNKFLEGQSAEIKDVKETVDGLTKAIIELAKSDDQKIAEQITPRAHVTKDAAPIWLRAASQSDKNVIDDDDEKGKKLLENKPTNNKSAASWVGEAMGGQSDPNAAVPM